MISSATITTVLNKQESLAQKAKQLVDAANAAGGNDNITAVLVENNKQPIQLEAVKPVEKKNTGAKSKLSVVKTAAQQDGLAAKKNNSGLIIFLCLLSLGLLAALIISLSRNRNILKENNNKITAHIVKQPDEKMLSLISFANDTSRKYAMTAGSSIIVSEAILLNKDSFYLQGNGDSIIAGENYKGPAFIISNTAKHVVLDSLVFKDLDVGIVIEKDNVVLKNVRFINCRVPVQYLVSFPDSVISGRVKDSIFINNSKPKLKL